MEVLSYSIVFIIGLIAGDFLFKIRRNRAIHIVNRKMEKLSNKIEQKLEEKENERN